MNTEDLRYICTVIGNLAGIPIRLFEGDKQVFYHALVRLPKDPMTIYSKELWTINEHVGYYVTPHFDFYGIVNSGNRKIIIGPSKQLPDNDQDIRTLAFQMDLESDDIEDFIRAVRSIVHMPMESVLQILCTLNFVLNGEKLELKDIVIHQDTQELLIQTEEDTHADSLFSDQQAGNEKANHTTYEIEQMLMDIVRKGNISALQEWIAHAPAVHAGTMAAEPLQQAKNTFTVTAVLVSRAAIQGGMSIDDSFSLSDAYIQQCMLMNTSELIFNLHYRLIIDYTERVNRIHVGKHPNKLVVDVANYIQHHLSEAITTGAVANELFISRPYLSKRFKEEAGIALSDFITREKIEEAKRLLRYTDKDLNSIALYLGFSSQSHFSRVFKKIADRTPSAYREKYKG